MAAVSGSPSGPQRISQGNNTITLSSSFYIDIAFQNSPSDLKEAVGRSQNWVYNGEPVQPSLE
jgi:hypothetical protein